MMESTGIFEDIGETKARINQMRQSTNLVTTIHKNRNLIKKEERTLKSLKTQSKECLTAVMSAQVTLVALYLIVIY